MGLIPLAESFLRMRATATLRRATSTSPSPALAEQLRIADDGTGVLREGREDPELLLRERDGAPAPEEVVLGGPQFERAVCDDLRDPHVGA